MSLSQLNQLRPGAKVRQTIHTSTWVGTVFQIWPGDSIRIRWSDGVVDTLAIDEENARRLEE